MDGMNEECLVSTVVASLLKCVAADAVVARFEKAGCGLINVVRWAVYGCEGVGFWEQPCAGFEGDEHSGLGRRFRGGAVAGSDINSSEQGGFGAGLC